jgi:carbonic anhydrase
VATGSRFVPRAFAAQPCILIYVLPVMDFRNPAAAALRMSAIVLLLSSTVLAAGGGTEWYPASVESWANKVNGHDRVCQEGYQQSPVDLPGCNASSRPTRPSINVTWANQQVTLTNNGHTVQITPQGSSKGQMFTDIAGTIKSYTLAQCHFHWGSEHVIDGVQQVMELHCVHVDDGAPGDGPKYGVLGIFYEVGTASTFLSQFEDQLPTLWTRNRGGDWQLPQTPARTMGQRIFWRRSQALTSLTTGTMTAPLRHHRAPKLLIGIISWAELL